MTTFFDLRLQRLAAQEDIFCKALLDGLNNLVEEARQENANFTKIRKKYQELYPLAEIHVSRYNRIAQAMSEGEAKKQAITNKSNNFNWLTDFFVFFEKSNK